LQKKGHFLFDHQPLYNSYTLASMQPISFQARDGLIIHGYLTLPCTYENKKIPLVLRVHGGPWERTDWGLNPEVQWLASRGYAVLQVDYRESIGYGKAFVHAGDKQWGRAMQNDLTDAVKWAINSGIADPQCIAIMVAHMEDMQH
jgi:dipeptidyl aminopeptidase/acylaminoacyl peptidase